MKIYSILAASLLAINSTLSMASSEVVILREESSLIIEFLKSVETPFLQGFEGALWEVERLECGAGSELIDGEFRQVTNCYIEAGDEVIVLEGSQASNLYGVLTAIKAPVLEAVESSSRYLDLLSCWVSSKWTLDGAVYEEGCSYRIHN